MSAFRNLILLVIITCIHIIASGQVAHNYDWSKIFNGSASKGEIHVKTDNNGNIYSIQRFDGHFIYGSYNYTSSGNTTVLMKHDRHGNAKYVKIYPFAMSVVADDDENLYVVGYDYATIAKLDKFGRELWRKQLGGGYNAGLSDVAVNNRGNLIVTGYFYGHDEPWGNLRLKALQHNGHILISEIDFHGNVIWVKCTEGSYPATLSSVAIDKADNIYLLSSTENPLSYDGVTQHVACGNCVFLSKLSDTGAHLWTRTPGYSPFRRGLAHTMSVKTDDSNNVFIIAGQDYRVFVARHDSSGNELWVKESPFNNLQVGLTLDNEGDCYVTGTVGTFWADYKHKILKYSRDGKSTKEVWTTGSSNIISGGALVSDRSNNLYTTGSFDDKINLGGNNYTSSNSPTSDSYLLKLGAGEWIDQSGYDKPGYCRGSQATVYFSNADTVFKAGNSFIFELSDHNGNFGKPVLLGNYTTAAPSDSFKFSLSANVVQAGNYRVRIRSTKPVYYSIADSIFVVDTIPMPPIIIANSQSLVTSVSGAGSLQWYQNGQPVTGATDSVFNPTSSGNYSVMLTTPFGCTVSSAAHLYAATGIQPVENSPIKVYPNPIVNQLVLQYLPHGAEVTLTDVSGRTVYRDSPRETAAKINTEKLLPGVYFLVIRLQDGSVLQHKVIK